MMDIEIVKVGLKYHRHSHEEGCVQGSQACPYIAKGDRCFHILLEDALSAINEQQAEIERLKEHKPNRVYTVVQVRKAFTKAIHDLVKSPLADEMYFHLMGKTEYNLSEMEVGRNENTKVDQAQRC